MDNTYCAEGEKIGVARIKVVQQSLHATAIVGSSFCVDKLLQSWSTRLGGKLYCHFEISYHDGRIITGTYRMRGTRPALMAFVRTSVEAQCKQPSRSCAVRGLARQPEAFLERYEFDDFEQSGVRS